MSKEVALKKPVQRHSNDMYLTDANFAAAILLLRGEIQSAEKFISFALRRDKTSVHAWLNKGMYSLMCRPPNIQEAVRAEKRVQELERQEEPLKQAMVDHAYWLVDVVRGEKNRELGLQVLHSLLGQEKKNRKIAPNLSHHYTFAKLLARRAKEPHISRDTTVLRDLLRKFVYQLTILASSKNPLYMIEMWTYLAEVQLKERVRSLLDDEMIKPLLSATRCNQFDIRSCVHQINQYESKSQPRPKNYFKRLATFYNYLAKIGTNTFEKENFRRKAEEASVRANKMRSTSRVTVLIRQ